MISEVFDFLSDVWYYKPDVIVLLVVGFVMFWLLVIDTHNLRRKRQERHRSITGP